MVNTVDVIDGRLFYDNGILCGQMLVTYDGVGMQLHSQNISASSIKVFRYAKEFVKNKHNLFTACEISNNILLRLIKMIGFKQIEVREGYVIFLKE